MINYLICFATVNKTVVSFYHSSLKSYFFSCGWPSYNPGHVKVRMCFSHVLLPITVPQLNSSTTKKNIECNSKIYTFYLSIYLLFMHYKKCSLWLLCSNNLLQLHIWERWSQFELYHQHPDLFPNFATKMLK